MRIACLAVLLATSSALAQTPTVTWTVEFDEPTIEGFATPGGVDSAPGGELCAASTESLSGARSRVVVRRYNASGDEVWSHPVESWVGWKEAANVATDGPDCLVSAVFFDPGARPVGVARVGPGGVAFATRFEAVAGRNDAFVQPDGSGGAWLAIAGTVQGGDDEPSALLIRVDDSGAEVARVERFSDAADFDQGVRAFAVTPDGRAVATATGDRLLVVAPDGTIEADVGVDLTPGSALALDGAGGVFLLLSENPDANDDLVVQRYTLDGTLQWTTPLGETDTGAFARPHALLSSGGDVVAVWRDSEVSNRPRATRLSGTTGAVVWNRAIGAEFQEPQEIVATPGGAAVLMSGDGDRLVGISLATGEPAWTVGSSDAPNIGFRRSLAACGPGVCVQSRDDLARDRLSVDARDGAGALAWTATRTGARVPSRRIRGAALAPDGGLYTIGERKTGVRDRGFEDIDLAVSRLTPAGTVAWTYTMDLEGENGSAFAGALGVVPDGGVVVTATSDDEDGRSPLAMRLRPDGSLRWLTTLSDDDAGAGSLAVTPDGGAVVVVSEGSLFFDATTSLVRLDADGGEVWRSGIGENVFALGLYRTGDVFAAPLIELLAPNQTRLAVARIGADGAEVSRDVYDSSACPVVFFGIVPETDIDAAGVVTAAVSGACGEERLVRFAPDGTITSRLIEEAETAPVLDTAPGGDTVLGYTGPGDLFGLTRVVPDDGPRWNTGLALGGSPLGVAALPTGGALAAAVEFESGVPTLLAVDPDGSVSSRVLSRPAGLPISGDGRSPIVLDGAGGAYLVLLGATPRIRVPSVSRVDGLPVSSEAEPDDRSRGLLRLVGANPLASGAPLRLALGAPAAVAVLDVRGRRLAQWSAEAGERAFSLPPLPAGLYLVRATSADGAMTARMVIR